MKYILTALSALLLSYSVQAQTDAKAQTILQAASKKMAALKSLKANFSLALKGAKTAAGSKKSGTFLLKGQKYRVSMPNQEIISDGRTVWTYLKGVNEVQVTNQGAGDQAMSPAKLFTNFYDKEYKYRYVGSRTVSGKPCDIVEMVPVNKARQFSKIELAIDKNSTVAGGTVYEKNGNQYLYEVSGFQANAAIADNQFTFDAKSHPGVEVVDLR